MRKRLPKIFFGWWTVMAGSLLSLWGYGYSVYGFSAIFKPLSAELGFSRAVTSIAAGISQFGGGIEAPVTGWLTDRFGPRRVILFGITLFSLGLILMNYINSLWSFYVVWGVLVGTGINSALAIPLQKAITNWFVKKRGIAISIRWVVSGLLILPLITWFITNYSWRVACVIGGITMLVVGLPLVLFLIRDKRPEYYGLMPDGANSKADNIGDKTEAIKKGVEYAAGVREYEFTVRQAIKTRTYWLLIFSQIGFTAATRSLLMHFVPLLTDMGIEPVSAATTIMVAGLFGIGARFVSGILADRVTTGHLRFLYGGGLFMQAASIFIFLFNQTTTMVYVFLILYYIGMGVGLVLVSLVGGRYFGRKAFGTIRGSMQMIVMPAGIMAPIYLGWVYDTSGEYSSALLLFAILLSCSSAAIMFTRPPRPPAVVSDIEKFV